MPDRNPAAHPPTGGPDPPLAIIGAGAAGLLAALFASRAGARVTLLETRPRPGAKIRVSGGGRCNVLPSRAELDDFHTSGSPRALRNILFSWPLADVRAFFEEDLGVPLKTEDTGKVFPVSDRSRDVVDALLAACDAAGVELCAPYRVTSLRPEAGGFLIRGADGVPDVRARRVILATGGLSLPKTGSDGAGLAFARALGHRIVATHPALVPLLSGDPAWGDLAGLSVPAVITAEREGRTVARHAGDFLFTHRGFSGPAVLDASRHVTAPDGNDVTLRVRWGGVADWEERLTAGGRATVGSAIRPHLPRRLAAALLTHAGVDGDTRLSELSRHARRALVGVLDAFALPVTGNEGYRTAEVTAGGVPLEEVSPKTLESRVVPGLHFCGEILDGTGRLGGFNFLWAWTSGRRAGEAAAR